MKKLFTIFQSHYSNFLDVDEVLSYADEIDEMNFAPDDGISLKFEKLKQANDEMSIKFDKQLRTVREENEKLKKDNEEMKSKIIELKNEVVDLKKRMDSGKVTVGKNDHNQSMSPERRCQFFRPRSSTEFSGIISYITIECHDDISKKVNITASSTYNSSYPPSNVTSWINSYYFIISSFEIYGELIY